MSHIVLSRNRLRHDNKWRIKYESLKESCSVKSPDCPLNYCEWQRDNWARRNIFVGVSNVAVFIFFPSSDPEPFRLSLFSSGLKFLIVRRDVVVPGRNPLPFFTSICLNELSDFQ